MLRVTLEQIDAINNLQGSELENHVVFLIANNLLGDEISEIGKITDVNKINNGFIEDFIKSIVGYLQDLLTSGFVTDSAVISNIESAIFKLHEFSTYETRQQLISKVTTYLSDDDAQYIY